MKRPFLDDPDYPDRVPRDHSYSRTPARGHSRSPSFSVADRSLVFVPVSSVPLKEDGEAEWDEGGGGMMESMSGKNSGSSLFASPSRSRRAQGNVRQEENGNDAGGSYGSGVRDWGEMPEQSRVRKGTKSSGDDGRTPRGAVTGSSRASRGSAEKDAHMSGRGQSKKSPTPVAAPGLVFVPVEVPPLEGDDGI